MINRVAYRFRKERWTSFSFLRIERVGFHQGMKALEEIEGLFLTLNDLIQGIEWDWMNFRSFHSLRPIHGKDSRRKSLGFGWKVATNSLKRVSTRSSSSERR